MTLLFVMAWLCVAEESISVLKHAVSDDKDSGCRVLAAAIMLAFSIWCLCQCYAINAELKTLRNKPVVEAAS